MLGVGYLSFKWRVYSEALRLRPITASHPACNEGRDPGAGSRTNINHWPQCQRHAESEPETDCPGLDWSKYFITIKCQEKLNFLDPNSPRNMVDVCIIYIYIYIVMKRGKTVSGHNFDGYKRRNPTEGQDAVRSWHIRPCHQRRHRWYWPVLFSAVPRMFQWKTWDMFMIHVIHASKNHENYPK